MDHSRVFDQEMAQVKDLILKMGVMVQGLIKRSVESLKDLNRQKADEVIKDDEKVDQLELEINEKCVELTALRQPEASDLRFLMTGMRLATDLERIGDLAEDIAERTVDLIGKTLPKPLIDIPRMAQVTQEAVALALDAFVNSDITKAKIIWEKEKEVDQLRDRVQDELIEVMQKNAAAVPQALALLLAARHLERISDHATNIAEDVIYMVAAKVVKHQGKTA